MILSDEHLNEIKKIKNNKDGISLKYYNYW